MISKMTTSLMMAFSSAKFRIVKGKYLLPVPPKRLPSSFLLFSNEIRPTLLDAKEGAKNDITKISKIIGEKWNSLTPEEKAKYEKRAEEYKKKHGNQSTEYEAKFVQPFKRVNIQNLITKAFYENTQQKFTNIAEGAQAVKKYRESLTPEQLEELKNKAEQINARNQKITKVYEIPVNEYKTFSSFYRSLQKKENLGPLSEQDEKTVEKYRKQFEEYQAEYKTRLVNFARSFHITPAELTKLLEKQKTQEEKLQETAQVLKESKKNATEKTRKQLQRVRAKIATEKQKIIQAEKKRTARRLAALQQQLEKKRRLSERSQKSLETKLNTTKRLLDESKRTKSQKQEKNSTTTQKTEAQTQTQ